MYQYLDDIQKKRLFNSVLAVTVLLAVFLGIESINSLKENSYIGKGMYAVNTITVSGQGNVFAIPDTGLFSFSVVEIGKTVKEAQDKSSKKINSILNAIRDMGVEEKDIKTVGYNSNPKYNYVTETCPLGQFCSSKSVLVGYEVSQSISVKIRKTSDAGAILSKVGSLGASNLSGLSFVTDDLDKVKAEARNKAILNAKDKAGILAKSLGVKLVRIISFSELGDYPIPYYAMGGMEKAVSMDVATPPQTPVGENEIVSNVSITYEIK